MSAFGIDVDLCCIRVFAHETSKQEVLDGLIEAVACFDDVADREGFRAAVYQREAIMSTGIGDGVAVPHVRFEGVHKPTIAVGLASRGVAFGSPDGQPARVIVLFAMPAGAQREYLGLLAQVMTSLKKAGFRERLESCTSPEEAAVLLRGEA